MSEGLILGARVYVHDLSEEVELRVEDVRPAGHHYTYLLTPHELGVHRDLQDWLDTVRCDITARLTHHDAVQLEQRRQMMAPLPVQWPPLTAMEVLVRERAARNWYEEHRRHLEQLRRSAIDADLEQQFVAGFTNLNQARHTVEAIERSKDLFVMVAGAFCHATLEKGSELGLKGSAGGSYWLKKAMTYCVSSADHSARYCAVVPGVPIWDHLLGIKLMIENDEPHFLKVANKAITGGGLGGAMADLLTYGMGVTWADNNIVGSVVNDPARR